MIEQPLEHDDLVDHAELQARIAHADLSRREHHRITPRYTGA